MNPLSSHQHTDTQTHTDTHRHTHTHTRNFGGEMVYPHPFCRCFLFRDWSLIMGRGGGLQNRKIAGLKVFAPPPPQDMVKLFAHTPPPPFKEWKRFVPPPPPPSIWLKFQATAKKRPQNFLGPLQHGQNFFHPPFRRGKTSHTPPPPLPFCSPTPPPPPSPSLVTSPLGSLRKQWADVGC